MRIKVERGSDPLSLFYYLCDPKKQLQADREALIRTKSIKNLLICQTIPGTTVQVFARNFQKISSLNPRVKKTIAHYSVSLPFEDNEAVGRLEMRQISQVLLEDLGHGRSPYFGIAHHDTNHHHWHLAASTIGYDGQWVDDSYERHRIRKIEKSIEIAFGLKKSQFRAAVDIKNLSTGEYRLKRRTQRFLPKEKLWVALDDCIQRASSLERFILELRVRYPEVSVRLKKINGKHVGISFEIDGIAFAGRRLGRGYSLNGLSIYHGINQEKTSEPFVDALLELSISDCKDIHTALENNDIEFLPKAVSLNAWQEKTAKPQIEA